MKLFHAVAEFHWTRDLLTPEKLDDFHVFGNTVYVTNCDLSHAAYSHILRKIWNVASWRHIVAKDEDYLN